MHQCTCCLFLPSIYILTCADSLSGLVLLQVVIYFKLYPRDPVHTKGLVSVFTQRPDFSFPYPLLRFLAYGEAHARRLRFDTNFV